MSGLYETEFSQRSFKQQNVLVNWEGVPCLADFGVSRMMEEGTLWATSATQAAGSARWQAPELLNGTQITVTTESDVYAWASTALVCICETTILLCVDFNERKFLVGKLLTAATLNVSSTLSS